MNWVIALGSINCRGLQQSMEAMETIADIFNFNQLDVLLLQDINFAQSELAHVTRFRQELMGKTGITLIANLRNNSQKNGDCAIAYKGEKVTQALKKVKLSADGRSVSLVLNTPLGRLCLTSLYLPPNPHAKHNVASRVLHNARRHAFSCKAQILGGDFNCSLQENDLKRITYSGHSTVGGARPFGALRDFVLDHGLQDSAITGYTHCQRTHNGITFSRKDRFLFDSSLKQTYSATEPLDFRSEFSDHCVILSTFSWLQHDTRNVPGESPRTLRPYFRDRMRKYSNNMTEYLITWTRFDAPPRISDINDSLSFLEAHHIDTKSVTCKPCGQHLRLGWSKKEPAWRAAAIILDDPTLRAKYKLGVCYYKVQTIQENMKVPLFFENRTIQERVIWLHKVLQQSMDSVCGTIARKPRQRSPPPTPPSPLQLQDTILKLLTNVLNFERRTHMFKRSLGQLRKILKRPFLKRKGVLLQLFKHHTELAGKLRRERTSQRAQLLKKTKTSLASLTTRTKRVFDDIFDRRPASVEPIRQDTSTIDIASKTEKLISMFEKWTPPIVSTTPITDIHTLQLWMTESGHPLPEDILEELKPQPHINEAIWSDLLKTITIDEVDAACSNKTSGPGKSRISHRMVLYSEKSIKIEIAKVLTEMLVTGEVPALYKEALLKPIPKEPGKALEEACRPIIIQEVIWKILMAIISDRIQVVLKSEQLIFPGTFGFLRGKKIQEALHIKLRLEELDRQLNRDFFNLELDISKAYDFTRGHLIDIACKRLKLPPQLCTLVRKMREGARNLLVQHNEILRTIAHETLQQGNPLAGLLFIFTLDPLLQILNQSLQGIPVYASPTLGSTPTRIKAVSFADDITTYHETEEDAERCLKICDIYFRINMQSLNYRKSVLRLRQPKELRGRLIQQLTLITGSQTSRYLGLFYAPDGSICGMRAKVEELFQRLEQRLRAQTCSASIRISAINRVIIPKLTYLLSASCWRIHDLDYFRHRIKCLLDKRLSDEIVFTPRKKGGAGVVDISVTGPLAFITSFLSAHTNREALRTAQLLLQNAVDTPTITFRTKQAAAASWPLACLDALKIATCRKLHTSRDPLSIQVDRFSIDRTHPLPVIKTFRDYMTFLQLTTTNAQGHPSGPLEVYDVFPETDAFRLAHTNPVSLTNWMQPLLDTTISQTLLSDNLYADGWALNTSNTYLRRGNRFINKLLRAPLNTKPAEWKHWRLPSIRISPSSTFYKANSVVAYNWCTVLSETGCPEAWPQLGVVISTTTQQTYISPLTYVWKNGNIATTLSSDAPNKQRTTHSNCCVPFPNYRPEEILGTRWNLERHTLLTAWINRRAVIDQRLINSLPTSLDFDAPALELFTDGSCTHDGSFCAMGAGAIVLHRETQQHEDFITWIPPICKSSWKQPVSSMFSEIIAAALGAWIASFIYKRTCIITTDSQALQHLLLRPENWSRLVAEGGHYGTLLNTFLNQGIIQSCRWIRAHQSSRDMSLEAKMNQLADALASQSRRQASTSASIVQLPLFSDINNNVNPIPLAHPLRIPRDRNQRIPSHPQNSANSEWLLHGTTSRGFTPPTLIFMTKVPEDSSLQPCVTLAALRLRQGLLPGRLESIITRPDIYGMQPTCPFCAENGGPDRLHFWAHILFHCKTTASAARHYTELRDTQHLAAHEHSKRNQMAEGLCMSQVLNHRSATIQQSSSCRKCNLTSLDGYHWKIMLLEKASTSSTNVAKEWKNTHHHNRITLSPEFFLLLVTCLEQANADNISIGLPQEDYQFCVIPSHVITLHAPPNWRLLFGWDQQDSWWNQQIIQGRTCHHKEILPTCGTVLVADDSPPDRGGIPLAMLRPLWQALKAGGNLHLPISPTSDIKRWTADVPNITLHSTRSSLIVLPDRHIEYSSLHWWYGHTLSDCIQWYLEPCSQGLSYYDKLTELSNLACARMNKTHRITQDVLWDTQHIKEFHQDFDKTPYIGLTAAQKQLYRQILTLNRQARATNQTTSRIRDILVQT